MHFQYFHLTASEKESAELLNQKLRPTREQTTDSKLYSCDQLSPDSSEMAPLNI